VSQDGVGNADQQIEGGHQVGQGTQQLGLGQDEQHPRQSEDGGDLLSGPRREIEKALKDVLQPTSAFSPPTLVLDSGWEADDSVKGRAASPAAGRGVVSTLTGRIALPLYLAERGRGSGEVGGHFDDAANGWAGNGH